MVRVGAKRRRTLPQVQELKRTKLLGKRPNSSKAPPIEDEQRSSKRAKKTAVPYQTPESIDKIVRDISSITAPQKVNVKKESKKKIIKQKSSAPSTKKKLATKSQKPKKRKPSNKQVAKAKKILKKTTIVAKQSSVPQPRKRKQVVKAETSKKLNPIKKAKSIKNDTKQSATTPAPGNKKRISKKEALDPKPHVTLYEKDPTLYSKIEIPHISTFAHSRLLFRAIAMNDLKLLKKLVTTDAPLIYSLCIPRSPVGEKFQPLSFAIKLKNKEAIKILSELDKSLEKKLGSCPDLLIEAESTGHGSRMMFGHGLRTVTVGRGGKEGNAAFLKDSGDYNQHTRVPTKSDYNCLIQAIQEEMSCSMLEYYVSLDNDQESTIWRQLLSNIELALRSGNLEISGKLISMAVKKGGYGFNFLHEQSVTHTDEPFSDFKPVSVVKKSIYTCRVTPLHCACINPNPYYLQTLLNSRPEYTILDRNNWMPVHYAAVCVGVEPLKLLLSRGVSTMTLEKEGNTPLYLASLMGRVENVEAILEHELQNLNIKDDENEEEEATTSKAKANDLNLNSSLEKVNKMGMRPLHIGIKKGHVNVVKVLLNHNADAEKFTPAQFDKLTPLMIACQEGHLEIVKILVNHGVKLAATDRRGRTATAHAVINGHAHVLSYLLRLGVDPNVTDSSGNTLAHYASAYGWYFNLKLLLEAGCDVAKGNDWKLTPLAIAFMKGHIGIVEMLVKEPGVEVNTPVDGDSGMTLLLTACSSTTLMSSLIPRLKFLVEELNADCKLADMKGKNALHHLASHTLDKDSMEKEEFSKKLQNLTEAIKYLIDHGCDPNATNLQNKSPIMVACSSGNFWLAQKFIDWGVKLDLMVDTENEDTLLHTLSNSANKQYAQQVYEKLGKEIHNLKVLKEMVQVKNKRGFTPLFQTVHVLKTQSQDEIPHIIHFIKFLVNKLDSDVNAVAKNKEIECSILHSVVETNYATKIIPILLTNHLSLNTIDKDGRTPLSHLILNVNGNVEVPRQLIEAGARVNCTSEKDDNLNLLLLLAMKKPQLYELVPQMISKGADFKAIDPNTGNSVLHFVAQHPKLQSSIEAIKALVRVGANVNALNKERRTPLHLMVNARENETDVDYDAEDFLLTSGADLKLKDIRGRTILHYVFVKIGKPFDKSYLDPIELVTILLNSTKNPTQLIRMSDNFGCTPLHYSSIRGSTICCSYFTTDMKGNIDVKDMRGNTPFGLSVWSGHEGSALHFQQQGADFLQLLDTNIEIVKQGDAKHSLNYDDDENDSDSESKCSDNDSGRESSGNSDKEVEEETIENEWIWEHKANQSKEINKMKEETMKYPIFQEVVKKEWQGILHLMLAKLHSSGESISIPVATAIKTQKLRLAIKLLRRVKNASELDQPNETLLHTLAINSKINDQPDFQVQVLKLLLEKGVNPKKLDYLAANPIIYTAMNQNLSLLSADEEGLLGWKPQQLSLLSPDQLGRTPFSALFWKLNEYQKFSEAIIEWANSLLAAGASPNVLTKFPFVLSPYPTVKCLTKYHKDHNSFTLLSPLIVAVIHGRYDVVSWLMRQKSHVNVNFADEQCRTALHHAVRLNDLKMVKILFNPQSYNHEKDLDPWTINYSNWSRGKSSQSLDVEARDKRGWTAVDYLVCPWLGESYQKYCYENVEQLLTILFKAGASFTIKSGDGLSPLERSVKEQRFHIVQIMHKLLKTPVPSQYACKSVYGVDSPTKEIVPYITSYLEDAKKSAVEKGFNIDVSNLVVLPDPLLNMESDNSEVVIDPVSGTPFDCVMTQVDLSYGMNGLYNFYKMQLVKQPRGKKLVVLLTQWGRVGLEGQHQKTPFPTEENGIEEFKKIFRSKSGNNWDDIKSFQPLPKKYRLVHRDLTSNRPSEISVDFNKLEKKGEIVNSSLLQDELYKLVKRLAMVHQLEIGQNNRNHYRRNQDTSLKVTAKLPIVSTESLQKADVLLKRIKVLLAQKHKMHYDHFKASYSEEERLKIFDQLADASEEYYTLIPVYGFASETLQPIFEFYVLNERQEEIYKLIHLGFAKELLLAAEYNSGVTNPFEYIYRCLGIQLTLLDIVNNNSEKFEGQLILQYINSSSPKTKIQGIYKIQRPNEQQLAVDNRWLLWHGTKPENVLSVLHSGLQVAPLGVDRMGELFGKGIYFADTFTKSEGYARSHSGSKSKYIFLCEVALGKIQNVRINSDDVQNHKPGTERILPKGLHSSKTADSKFIPDPAATIIWNGKSIPLGPCVEQEFPKNQYAGLDYNEYIIFNPNQVKLRYLIEFQ